MAGWLHGVFVGDWLFVFPLCGFSLSLFCNYMCSLYISAFPRCTVTDSLYKLRPARTRTSHVRRCTRISVHLHMHTHV